MTEKRFNYRIGLEGGDPVKGELRAVGEAGNKAFDAIDVSATEAGRALARLEAGTGALLPKIERLGPAWGQAFNAVRQAAPAEGVIARINRATGVAGAERESTAAILAQGRALDDLRARYNPVFATVQRYRGELMSIRAAHAQGAISADEMTAAISRERQAALASIAAHRGRAAAIGGANAAIRSGNFRLQQMFYQVNDIGVSLVSGQNPFTVMAQQGTQIAQIYGFGNGGVGAALRDIGGLARGAILRLGPIAAVIGAATAAVAGMRYEINRTTDAQVSLGDTARAVVQVIVSNFTNRVRPVIQMIAPWLGQAWDTAISVIKPYYNLMINGFRAAMLVMQRVGQIGFEAIAALVQSVIPTINAQWESMRGVFFLVVSEMQGRWAGFLSTLADGAAFIPGFDGIAEGLETAAAAANETNAALRTGAADAFTESRRLMLEAAALRQNAVTAVTTGVGEALREAAAVFQEDPLGDFFSDVRARAIENALARVEGASVGAGGAAREAADEAARGWAAVQAALNNYVETATNWGEGLGGVLTNAFGSAESAIRSFVETGRIDFGSMVRSMVADLAVLQARMFFLGPLAERISGGGGGFFGNFLQMLGGGGFGSPSPVRDYASGAVMSSPILFPMQGGLGRMAEAGPEAIMPLARDAGGRLGVRTQGAGGGFAFNQVIENHGVDVSQQWETGINGDRTQRLVVRAMNRALTDGSVDQGMRTYGAKRTAVVR